MVFCAVYLIDGGREDKKKCVIERKLKFENCKDSLEAAQLENKINYFEKNKADINSIKEYIKNNRSMLKIQQGLKVYKV